MKLDRSEVKRMLVITLSNVGDIILTTPAIRSLRKEYPGSRIDVMVGPQGKGIFEKDPDVFKLIIYDKHMPISQKRRLQLKLKKLRYDLVVDLKNTVFPLLIGPRFRTQTIQSFPSSVTHSIQKHLYRLRSLGIEDAEQRPGIYIPKDDEDYIASMIEENGIGETFVVVNPGAKSHLKRWTIEGFSEVSDRLIRECSSDVVFIGMDEDKAIAEKIAARMKSKAHDLVGKTNIRQLASLIKRSKLIVTNDSAPLHLGSAVGTKVLALFGPTDPKKYGPIGEFDVVINEKLSCSPCESAECKHNYECMKLISPQTVFDTAKMMLEGYE